MNHLTASALTPTTQELRRVPTANATTTNDRLQVAVEGLEPLMPQLADLGVTVITVPGDTFAGAVTRRTDDTTILVLPQDVTPTTAERLARYWIGTLYGHDTGRPLVIHRRDQGHEGPHLTFCPAGCVSDHSTDITGVYLADLSHIIGDAAHMTMPVWDGTEGTVNVSILSGHISIDPYSSTPERAVPHVDLQVFDDDFLESLDPGQLADIIAKVRAHADRLDLLRLALAQARAEWAEAQA